MLTHTFFLQHTERKESHSTAPTLHHRDHHRRPYRRPLGGSSPIIRLGGDNNVGCKANDPRVWPTSYPPALASLLCCLTLWFSTNEQLHADAAHTSAHGEEEKKQSNMNVFYKVPSTLKF
ncbi:hypothetical protein M8C21_029989, partial [Ambrosia artemisiifolia]